MILYKAYSTATDFFMQEINKVYIFNSIFVEHPGSKLTTSFCIGVKDFFFSSSGWPFDSMKKKIIFNQLKF